MFVWTVDMARYEPKVAMTEIINVLRLVHYADRLGFETDTKKKTLWGEREQGKSIFLKLTTITSRISEQPYPEVLLGV